MYVTFNILINGQGELLIEYTLHQPVHELIQELGLRFIVPDIFDELAWKRKAYWTAYPPNHIGNSSGRVSLYNTEIYPTYRQKPMVPWSLDKWNFYYFGMSPDQSEKYLTNSARSIKENIYRYDLFSGESGKALSVISDGTVACRISKTVDHQVKLAINHLWDYVNISWGNYWKNLRTESAWSGSVLIRFSDL